jgi:hypothetical protein
VFVGLPQGVGGLVFFLNNISVYFHDTHQVLAGLLEGVGGLAIESYFVLF